MRRAYLAQDGVVLIQRVLLDEFSHLRGHGGDLARGDVGEELEGRADLLVRHDLVHVVLLKQLVDRPRQEYVDDLKQANEGPLREHFLPFLRKSH